MVEVEAEMLSSCQLKVGISLDGGVNEVEKCADLMVYTRMPNYHLMSPLHLS